VEGVGGVGGGCFTAFAGIASARRGASAWE
jgi:hypothetical protein